MSSVAAQLTRALVLLLLLVTMLAQCSALPVRAHLLVLPISGGGVGGTFAVQSVISALIGQLQQQQCTFALLLPTTTTTAAYGSENGM